MNIIIGVTSASRGGRGGVWERDYTSASPWTMKKNFDIIYKLLSRFNVVVILWVMSSTDKVYTLLSHLG